MDVVFLVTVVLKLVNGHENNLIDNKKKLSKTILILWQSSKTLSYYYWHAERTALRTSLRINDQVINA